MRRRIVPFLLLAALALAVAAPASTSAADLRPRQACADADLIPTADTLARIGQATLCLINAERAAQGLAPVVEDGQLTAASLAFSQRMVGEGFFAHVAPDGSTLVQRLTTSGYLPGTGNWAAGENLAWGQGVLSTPRSIVISWMNSTGHRRNILSPDYSQIGLGVVMGTPGDPSWGATYTTDYGTHSTTPAPAATEPLETDVADQAPATVKRKAKAKAKAKPRKICRRVKTKSGTKRVCRARSARAAKRSR